MAKHQQDPAREAFWREIVQRHTASGLSVRAFCRQAQLAESAFYFWRRTIGARDGKLVLAKSRPMKRPVFVPAVVTGATRHEASIVIELAGGRALRFPESIPMERLVEVVHALEAGGAR